MLSNLICWQEAHLLIALKLPLINPVKQAFLLPMLKVQLYLMQMVVKPVFLQTARKEKQT